MTVFQSIWLVVLVLTLAVTPFAILLGQA